MLLQSKFSNEDGRGGDSWEYLSPTPALNRGNLDVSALDIINKASEPQ